MYRVSPFNSKVILHQYSIEERRDISRRLDGTVGIERGSGPHHVVGLPLSGLAIGIGQRRTLLVNARGLPIHVSLVVVRVEDLHLIAGITRPRWTQETARYSRGIVPIQLRFQEPSTRGATDSS